MQRVTNYGKEGVYIILNFYSVSHMFFFFMKGDVYPVETSDGLAFNQVLDAHWGVLNDEDVR